MKCAVITPIGPGHELLALDAVESVKKAYATSPGPFDSIAYIEINDTRGELGRSAARNQGVQLAQQAGADWLFFLDADDILEPRAFANVAPCIDRHDAVWGAIYELAADEESGVVRPGQLLEMSSLEQLLANDPWITLQIGHFVKTRAALATPFNPELNSGEDFDYYLRLWSTFNCIKIPVPLFYNRRNTHAGGPRATTDREWRIAVQRVICEKCAASDFHVDFEHRGERFRFYVFNPFDGVQRHHLKGRFFGLDELAYLETRLAPGAHIVEVGAYVGNHVIYYSRFMRPRIITVLEPSADAIGLLRRNLAANAVRNADLSRLGNVKSAPLDRLIESPVDFIKIDAEGLELEILAGAQRVIAASRPKIMIAISGDRVPAFRQWLDRSAYRVARTFEHAYAVNFLVEPAA